MEQTDRATTTSAVYENYFAAMDGAAMDVAAELRRADLTFRHFYRPHLPSTKNIRLIDVGCGFGKYLAAARKGGIADITGIDISKDQVALGRDRLGLPIEEGDAVEFLHQHKNSADMILLVDVLEHFDLEPAVELLNAIRQSLKSNGALLIQVPNGLAPFAPTFHGDVTHKRAFSTTSLAQILRMSGYKNFQFYAMPPMVHGLKSIVRRLLWTAVFSPLIHAYFIAAYGTALGGIYTANLIVVAKAS